MQENIQNESVSSILEDLEKKRIEQINWIKKLLNLGFEFSSRNSVREGVGYITILHNNKVKQKIIYHARPILDGDLK